MNTNVAVVGLQWGDEGKGKIVDLLAEKADCVARYQGGNNAGHTIRIGAVRHVLHLIPSGIFHPNVTCVVGNGVVLDPAAFFEETHALEAAGVSLDGRLFVSNRCHLILPYHRALEAAVERRLGDRKLDTTSRGIGPAYEDKAARRGLRVCDLFDLDALDAKIRAQVEQKNRMLEVLGDGPSIDPEPICADYARFGERMRPFAVDAAAYLNGLIRDGKSIVFEGAQATLLDVDHGTFPFVTSSSAAAGGAATGLGVSPKHIHSIVGVAKAYTTRVGAGPFPTELHGACAETLRSRGQEYGSTTGRPRRCGWLDGPALRYAVMINALDALAITKTDVLDALPEIQICVEYKYKGSVLQEFPPDCGVLGRVEPVYKTFRGWNTSISGIREWSKLPVAAQDYLKFISDYAGVPITMISTGAERDETIRVARS